MNVDNERRALESKGTDYDDQDIESQLARASDVAWYRNPQNYVRIFIAAVLTTFIIFALCHPTFSVDFLTYFLAWIQANPWNGSLAFVLAYVICNILMIPGMILSFGAGIIYSRIVGFWIGIAWGSGIVIVSCFIGSCLAFLNARFLLRNAVVYLIRKNRKFVLIDAAVKKQGFKVVLLLRLSPVTPYGLFNYLMGFSAVEFSDYCLGAIGMIPNIFVYVYIGATIQNVYQLTTVNPENNKVLLTMTIVGVVVLLCSLCYIGWMTRKELRRISKELRHERINAATSDIEDSQLTQDEYDSNDELL